MNFEQMSEPLQQTLMKAVELCQNRGFATIDTIQLLKVLFEDDLLDGLYKRLSINKREALILIDDELNKIATTTGSGQPNFL